VAPAAREPMIPPFSTSLPFVTTPRQHRDSFGSHLFGRHLEPVIHLPISYDVNETNDLLQMPSPNRCSFWFHARHLKRVICLENHSNV
jgi:hypothetical protein